MNYNLFHMALFGGVNWITAFAIAIIGFFFACAFASLCFDEMARRRRRREREEQESPGVSSWRVWPPPPKPHDEL